MADMEELHVEPTVSGRGLMVQGPLGVFKQRVSKVRVGLRTDWWSGLEQTPWRQARRRLSQ